MSDAHNTRNYFAHGGSELVIGGRLTFLPGASVEGVAQLPALPDSEASTVTALRQDYNNLLAALRTAGLMASAPADGGGDG